MKSIKYNNYLSQFQVHFKSIMKQKKSFNLKKKVSFMNKMRVYFETNCKRRQCALVY